MHNTAMELYELLRDRSLTIATAESCTGGMIGACLTAVPGMSQCYGFGVVSYANKAKEKLLGVSHSTLEEHGAVSPQTAIEMARGALNLSDADIAVSVTGIAGPGGGTIRKPVGLVYVGIAVKDKDAIAIENNFEGTRDDIRQSTVKKALELVINEIENL